MCMYLLDSRTNVLCVLSLYFGVANNTHSLLQVCKYDIEQSIKREMSGDLEDGMLAIGWLVTAAVFVTKS